MNMYGTITFCWCKKGSNNPTKALKKKLQYYGIANKEVKHDDNLFPFTISILTQR